MISNVLSYFLIYIQTIDFQTTTKSIKFNDVLKTCILHQMSYNSPIFANEN